MGWKTYAAKTFYNYYKQYSKEYNEYQTELRLLKRLIHKDPYIGQSAPGPSRPDGPEFSQYRATVRSSTRGSSSNRASFSGTFNSFPGRKRKSFRKKRRRTRR